MNTFIWNEFAVGFPQPCRCGRAFLILCGGERGESPLFASALYGRFFMGFFALWKNGRNRAERPSSPCSSLYEEGHFSEDVLNKVSLDSQQERFNCFWIHTGGLLCEGQNTVIWLSSPQFCLGGAPRLLCVCTQGGAGVSPQPWEAGRCSLQPTDASSFVGSPLHLFLTSGSFFFVLFCFVFPLLRQVSFPKSWTMGWECVF